MEKGEERPVVYSALEVANYCGVVNQTAINWIKNGHLKAYKTPGGQFRVYPDDLAEFMTERKMRVPDDVLVQCTKNSQENRKIKILFVDDDESFNNVSVSILRKSMPDAEIYQAFDGFEAGSMTVKKQPDCLILDAVGEAFDKCSKMMGLGYPGGPIIDRLAKLGNPERFRFAKPHIPGLDYSFSGVKTSLLYFVRDEIAKDPEFMEKNKEDICASFQKTLIDILMDKLVKAAKQTGIREITIGGGVSANSGLRERITLEGKKRGWNTYLPEFKFTTDNAAMIAIAGYYHYLQGERTPLDVAPVSRMADF